MAHGSRCNIVVTQIVYIHPVNPEPRRVRQAVTVIRDGGLIIYPTDSCYAFGWHMGNINALREIRRIRKTWTVQES